eukprot:4153035-Amphidinium_carterae.1
MAVKASPGMLCHAWKFKSRSAGDGNKKHLQVDCYEALQLLLSGHVATMWGVALQVEFGSGQKNV